jgi:hypothetical protein
VDGGPANDAGAPDAGAIRSSATPGCPAGSVLGRACAPSGVLWLSDAVVSVDAVDCAGQPVHAESTTDLDGYYRLDGVPAGEVELHIRKGSFATTAAVTIPAGSTLDLTGRDQKICFSRHSARIAVLTGAFDRVERVLDQLGLAYTTYSGTDAAVPTGLQLLVEPTELGRYDIVLVNCGLNYWSTIRNQPARWQTIMENLRGFLRAGGSLYASDWAFKLVEDPFPAFLDFNGIDSDPDNVNSGFAPQTIAATIEDPPLAHLLGGPSVSIAFPNQYPDALSNNWALMVGASAETRVLVRGDAHQCQEIQRCYESGPVHPGAPLLASFRPYGSGKVIFTSFHFETIASETVLTLLRYLIFLL